MVALNHTVDPNNAKQGDDQIPPGKYQLECVSAEMVETKAKTGWMIVFTFKVTEGPNKGLRFRERINWTNANPQAQEIGRRELDKIGVAMGLQQIKDTNDFIGKRFGAVIENKEDSFIGSQGDTITTIKNVIKKYFALSEPAQPAIEQPKYNGEVPWG